MLNFGGVPHFSTSRVTTLKLPQRRFPPSVFRKRLRTDEEELAEARRALRSVKPGDSRLLNGGLDVVKVFLLREVGGEHLGAYGYSTSRWWSRFGHIMSNMLADFFCFRICLQFFLAKKFTLTISNLKPAGASMMAASLDCNPFQRRRKTCSFEPWKS